jgi:hypothetical protein
MAKYQAFDYGELLNLLCLEIEAEDPDERERIQVVIFERSRLACVQPDLA